MSRSPRLATPDDYRAFFGREPDPGWAAWFGLVYETGGEIVGFGMVRHDAYGRAWGFLDMRQPLPALLMHRTAKRVLAALRAAGELVIYAQCDRDTPKAARWLRRLGFEAAPAMGADEVVHEGRTITLCYWSLRLADA